MEWHDRLRDEAKRHIKEEKNSLLSFRKAFYLIPNIETEVYKYIINYGKSLGKVNCVQFSYHYKEESKSETGQNQIVALLFLISSHLIVSLKIVHGQKQIDFIK